MVGLWDVERWRKEPEASKIVSHPALSFTVTRATRARHTHILLPPVCKDGSCAALWGEWGTREFLQKYIYPYICALISDKGLVCPYALVRTLKLHPGVDGNTAVGMYRETGFLTYKKCQVVRTQPEACSLPAPDKILQRQSCHGLHLNCTCSCVRGGRGKGRQQMEARHSPGQGCR